MKHLVQEHNKLKRHFAQHFGLLTDFSAFFAEIPTISPPRPRPRPFFRPGPGAPAPAKIPPRSFADSYASLHS